MLIDLKENAWKLTETVNALGVDELLGQLCEECSEAITAVSELQDALGPSITEVQETTIRKMIAKCAGLIRAAQKVRRAMKGTTPVTLDDALVHLNEECADVALCIDALTLTGAVDKNGIQYIGRYKNDRWFRRVCGETGI